MVPSPPLRPILLGTVLALATCLATALAGSPSGIELAVDASEDGTSLAIEITNTGPNASVTTLVAREDPLAGIVADRVLPTHLPSNATVRLQLDGLKAAENRSIRLVDGSTELPRLSNTQLFPPDHLDDVPAFLQQRVDARVSPDEPVLTGSARAHTVADPDVRVYRGDGDVVATRQGPVVAGYVERDREEPSDRLHNDTLWTFVSDDGGRSFGDPVPIVGPVNRSFNIWWSMVPATDGTVDVLYSITRGETDSHESSRDGPFRVQLRPAEGTTSEPQRLPVEGSGGALRDAVRTADGGLLAPSVAGGQLSVHRIAPNGSATEVLSTDHRVGSATGIELDRSPEGEIGLVYRESLGDHRYTVRTARSHDDGRSFSAPEPVPSLQNTTNGAGPRDLAVDAGGTLHATLQVTEGEAATAPWNGLYLRRGPAGDVQTRALAIRDDSLAPDAPEVLEPGLAVDGSRVWLFWSARDTTEGRPGPYAVESTSSGLTWGRTYQLDVQHEGSPLGDAFLAISEAALLPDGRPVLVGDIEGDRLVSMPLFDPLPDGDEASTIHRSTDDRAPESANETPPRNGTPGRSQTNTSTNATGADPGASRDEATEATEANDTATRRSDASREGSSPAEEEPRRAGPNGSSEADRRVPTGGPFLAVAVSLAAAGWLRRDRSTAGPP